MCINSGSVSPIIYILNISHLRGIVIDALLLASLLNGLYYYRTYKTLEKISFEYEVILPRPVLWGIGASQYTAQKVNRAPRCTRSRWFPVIRASPSVRWAEPAAQSPGQLSQGRRRTRAAQLGSREARPSWRNGVFTFLAKRLASASRGVTTRPLGRALQHNG